MDTRASGMRRHLVFFLWPWIAVADRSRIGSSRLPGVSDLKLVRPSGFRYKRMVYIEVKIMRGADCLSRRSTLGAWLSLSVTLSGCLTDFPPPIADGGAITTKPPQTDELDADISEPIDTTGATMSSVDANMSDPDAPVPWDDGGTSSPITNQTTTVSSPSTVGDAQVPPGCPSGTTDCDGKCTPGNSCCADTCEASNATTECRDEQCVIVGCDDLFFDCDGTYDNGCEQDMAAEDAPVASVDSPFPVPHFDFQTAIEEIDYRAWQGVTRYRLASGCGTCESNTPPPNVSTITPTSNRGKVPGASDLQANYALAWDETGLWVNLVVVDNELIADEQVTDSNGDARHYDNLMIVWDPSAGSSNPGSGDDHLTFIGIDERVTDWRAEEDDVDRVAVAVKGTGQCRSFHAYLPRQYLFGSDGSAPATFQPDDRHGLAVGYNDFDTDSATSNIERQHLVFGVDMSFASGTDYFQGDRTLPQLQLSEP
jgi:hypothetical protein